MGQKGSCNSQPCEEEEKKERERERAGLLDTFKELSGLFQNLFMFTFQHFFINRNFPWLVTFDSSTLNQWIYDPWLTISYVDMQVLWPESGWQPVSLADLITSVSVIKVYKKASMCFHPDKVQQRGCNLQQKYIAEKVFDVLKV